MPVQNGIPGASAAVYSVDYSLLWGGDESRIQVLRKDAWISSVMVDAANTPTTDIRKGLLLGKITASNKLVQWDPVAVDGTQELDCVLDEELKMLDGNGTAVDHFAKAILVAPLKASALRIKGAALVGHADEFLARRMLHESGCRLDDDPQGFLAGVRRRTVKKITNYTVLSSDNGTIFQLDTAAGAFTLPALKAGLNFEFVNLADFNMSVVSAEGDNMVGGNDASIDSVAWSTASNKIGARVRVQGVYVASVLKWLAEVVPAPFSTGAFLTQTLAT